MIFIFVNSFNLLKRHRATPPAVEVVEEEKSSDDNMVPGVDENKTDVQPPTLNPNEEAMPPTGQNSPQNQGQENDPEDPGTPSGSDGEVEDDSEGDSDDGDAFPDCFPRDPPEVDRVPFVEYPADAVRSSPSARNREFNRMVQENFVPYQKGMKGEPYRKRTNYEHQLAMG